MGMLYLLLKTLLASEIQIHTSVIPEEYMIFARNCLK
jgi:hypothetical protein